MAPASALLLAIAVSLLAWRAGALGRSGALAAAGIGLLVLTTTGWPGGLVLMAFFLPSSAVSRLWPGRAPAIDAKGDRRDAWQVLANGGFPALALTLGGPGALLAFAAGLTAAAADTWATAVGAHSASPPRHIFRGEVVPAGTSGGMTPLGTGGALVGAALVAVSALPLVGWRGAVGALLIGMGGMLLDSALGASVQGRFHCDRCGLSSERRMHRCGQATRSVGGIPWLSNDGVNALASLAATAAGWAAS
ncbi:MAG TPA: DUF92 domain-containing protein [Gemmatimonadales bacterium]|nr:DUF92 domain-containing protein [Gemmatimonadales bacterium]HRZ10185.1 DUF92 domain-containing protein [Gemmatimonadales bacterium]